MRRPLLLLLALLPPVAALAQTPGTASIPPPVGALAPNTWTLRPALPTGVTANRRTGKHESIILQKTPYRILVFGGDRRDDTGQTAVDSIDPLTGKLTILSPSCPPVPQYAPRWPDTGPVVELPPLDWLPQGGVVMLRGFWNSGGNAFLTRCRRDDANVLIDYAVWDFGTRLWLPGPWPLNPSGHGSDSAGPTGGVRDPDTDIIYMPRQDGSWGLTVWRLDVRAKTWLPPIRMGASLPRGPERSAIANAVGHRFDPLIHKGVLYIWGSTGRLVRRVLATGADSMVPLPGYAPRGDADEGCMALDPDQEVLFLPDQGKDTGATAPIQTLWLFDLRAQAWLPGVPVNATTNLGPANGACAYDPVAQAFVIYGRRSDPPQPGIIHTWYYPFRR